MICRGRDPTPRGTGSGKPSLPKPGTRIKAYGKYGHVMPYDHPNGTFPVRFDDGFWCVLGLDQVQLNPPEQMPSRGKGNKRDA